MALRNHILYTNITYPSSWSSAIQHIYLRSSNNFQGQYHIAIPLQDKQSNLFRIELLLHNMLQLPKDKPNKPTQHLTMTYNL
jgi:hypothetical protein